MNCVICKSGQTLPGTTTVTLTARDNSTIVIKNVPAEICENCGEYFLTEDISKQAMEFARKVIEHNAELQTLDFQKSAYMGTGPQHARTHVD